MSCTTREFVQIGIIDFIDNKALALCKIAS